MNAEALHAEAVDDERRARERLRNLDKARKAVERQRAREAVAERAAKRQRIAELRVSERQLATEHRKAFRAAVRLGQRVAWDEKEGAAWDASHAAQDRLLSVIAARRRLERELAGKPA